MCCIVYNIPNIRALLLEAFRPPEELFRFCQEQPFLQPLISQLGPNLADMIATVIDHCQAHDLWPELLAELKELSPGEYARFEGRLFTTTYDIGGIRNLLKAAFTDPELASFCQDRPLFRPITEHFGSKSSLVEKVSAVINYCQTRDLWGELLAEIERHNPRMYERHKDRASTHTPDTGVIGELLQAVFTRDELISFCREHAFLQPVLTEHGPKPADRVDLVIDYCKENSLFKRLLTKVKEVKPDQYDQHAPYTSPCVPPISVWLVIGMLILAAILFLGPLRNIIIELFDGVTPTPAATFLPPTSTSTPTAISTPSPTTTPAPSPSLTPMVIPIPMARVREGCTEKPGKFESPGTGFLLPVSKCAVSDWPDAIKLEWQVERFGSYAGCTIPLPSDFSLYAQKHTHLSIRVQVGEGGEQFRIGLSSDGAEWKEIVRPYSADWSQIFIPLDRFVENGVDLGKLDALVIAFDHELGPQNGRGSICIAEIGFGSP